jgi:hypothetical protein
VQQQQHNRPPQPSSSLRRSSCGAPGSTAGRRSSCAATSSATGRRGPRRRSGSCITSYRRCSCSAWSAALNLRTEKPQTQSAGVPVIWVGLPSQRYRRPRGEGRHHLCRCVGRLRRRRPFLFNPLWYATTCFFLQLGHVLVINNIETNMIEGRIHSRQSKLHTLHSKLP